MQTLLTGGEGEGGVSGHVSLPQAKERKREGGCLRPKHRRVGPPMKSFERQNARLYCFAPPLRAVFLRQATRMTNLSRQRKSA